MNTLQNSSDYPFSVDIIDSNSKSKENLIQNRPDLLTHRIRPIRLISPCTCLVIQASMSMGKSYRVEQYLTRVFARRPETRVVCISARIQQGFTIMGQLRRFKFELYSQDDIDLQQSSRVVCQYESLHRLSGVTKFDILLIDEYRGVCGQVSAPTNLEMQSENFKVFLHLHQNASVCLLLDAFMFVDNMVRTVLKHCFPSRERVHILIYRHTYLKRNFRVLPDELTFVNELLQHVAMAKRSSTRKEQCPVKIGLICRTASKLKHLMLCIVRIHKLQPTEYLQFDGHSDDRMMSKFSDINNSLSRVMVLGFTSKVTVGSDIQIPFYRIFVEANGACGPHVRDTFQMIGRFRNVNHPQVYVLLPRNTYHRSDQPNVKTELKRFNLAIAQKRQFAHRKQSPQQSKRTPILTAAEYALFLHINAISEVENKLQWVRQFYLTCERQLYDIEPYVPHHQFDTSNIRQLYQQSRDQSRSDYKDCMLNTCRQVVTEYDTDIALTHKKANPYSRIYNIHTQITEVNSNCRPNADTLFYCLQQNIKVKAAIFIAQHLHYPETLDIKSLVQEDVNRLGLPSVLLHHVPIFSTAVEMIMDVFNTWARRRQSTTSTMEWSFNITDLVHNRIEIGSDLRRICSAIDLKIENYSQHVEYSFIHYFKRVMTMLGFVLIPNKNTFYQCICMSTDINIKHCVENIFKHLIQRKRKWCRFQKVQSKKHKASKKKN